MKRRIYIPPSAESAQRHLRRVPAARMEGLGKQEFMKGYCSLAYLYPGFHPDGMEDWDGPPEVVLVAREAWRRAEAGELGNDELYPYQASKARIRRAQAGA